MKLNEKTEFGLLLEHKLGYSILEELRETHLKGLIGHGYSESKIEIGMKPVRELTNRLEMKHYVIRDTAMDMVKKIPLSEKFDIKFLNNLPDKKGSFLLGRNLNFRYWKHGSSINAVFLVLDDMEKGSYYRWRFLNLDLETGDVVLPEETEQKDDLISTNNCGKFKAVDYADDQQFKSFIQLLLFVELSELEIEILLPNQKTGTRKTGKYINESPANIEIVDSKWNVVSIRTEGFKVSGHWRMQPHGLDMQERKLIWIDTFQKHGYKRTRGMKLTKEI